MIVVIAAQKAFDKISAREGWREGRHPHRSLSDRLGSRHGRYDSPCGLGTRDGCPSPLQSDTAADAPVGAVR